MNPHHDYRLRLMQGFSRNCTKMGPNIHIQTDYGDETAALTPWELFGENDVRQALILAEGAAVLAQTITQHLAEGREK